jgi:methionyl-tRNA synthetase
LLSNRPEANDSVFTWDDFAAKINSELLANFGNFINRTAKFLSLKMDGVVGAVELEPADHAFIAKVNELLAEYTECMESVKLRAGLKTVMSISSLGNQYLQDCRLDNKLLQSQPARCHTVIAVATNLCYLLSAIVEPFLPSTSDDIVAILNAPKRTIPAAFTMDLLAGHQIGVPFLLFNKVEESLVKELRAKYAGKQV